MKRAFAILCAIAAALLSAAYVAIYLRGGPRIIDATSYWLEARMLAEGRLSFPLPEPEQAVLGRFLVRSVHDGVPHAAVIFPPGYPAVLALGFLVHAPMMIGPLLAAGITLATFALARPLADARGSDALVPMVATLFSVTCAALRYHTADTMSHGLAALCFAGSLALLFRASDRGSWKLAAASGLAAGWLFATRPVSAMALGIVIVFLALREPATRRLLPALALGTIPGIALFLAHQHAATGVWGLSSQRLYYALSDGPPDCFRYGFGAGIGCMGEHGDFVQARIPGGFGALAAAGTTLRRLKMHLVDPANVEPLALLVPIGAWMARAQVRGRALGLAVIAQILVYVPFYFDGNYPGGGARFFCDVLPAEHVLAAIAVADLASRRRHPERWAGAAVALSLVGFAVRAGSYHAMLRDREGGRPMFEASVLERAGITRGLVFLDTDHGFDLAFDPAPGRPIQFARHHGDDLDRITWEALGKPPAYVYRFSFDDGSAAVKPFVPGADRTIEGESLWPAIGQQGGWALPEWAAGTCASHDRWLAVHEVDARAPATITLALPPLGGRQIVPRLALSNGAAATVELFAGGASLGQQAVEAPPKPGVVCLDLPPMAVPNGHGRLTLRLTRTRGFAALDAFREVNVENN